MDDIEQAENNAAKKQKRSLFQWTKDHNLIFVKVCRLKNVHKNTPDLSKEQKWKLVLATLKSRPEFEELDVTFKTLNDKFHKELEKVLDRYGMTNQTVNLSGLPEKPPENDRILIDMAIEIKADNDKAKRKKIKEQQKKALLNNIEAVGLGRQGRRESFSSPSSVNDQQTSAISSATTTSISPPVLATSFIESMTNRLIDAIGSSNATGEDELKLSRRP